MRIIIGLWAAALVVTAIYSQSGDPFPDLGVSVRAQTGPYKVSDVIITSNEGRMDRYEVRIEKDGKPYWTLGPEDLPMTEVECLEADRKPCSEYSVRPFACYDPCLRFGPEYLTLDRTHEKIYLKVRVSEGKHQPYFLFVGDLRTRRARYLTLIGRSDGDAAVSPDQRLLAVGGEYWVQFVDLRHFTKENLENLADPGRNGSTYVTPIWKDDRTLEVQVKTGLQPVQVLKTETYEVQTDPKGHIQVNKK